MKIPKLLFPIFLILLTVILIAPGLKLGEFWWSDESRHAMDGVFIMDLLKDHPPLTSLYRYTEIYFAKYPALGLTWYPPFFALVEAVFFNIFAISEFTARLTLLFFTLLSVFFLYLLIKKASNEVVALLACLLFITTPVIVFWARGVMLELPALAMIILSCYFFYHYVFLDKPRHLYYLTLCLALTLYTKQITAFIIPVFLCSFLLQKGYKKLFSRQVVICLILFTIMLLPLVIFTLKFGTVGLEMIEKDMHQLKGQPSRMSVEHLLDTFNLFVHTFSWPVWSLIILSLAVFIWRLIKNKKVDYIFLFFSFWVMWWYLAFSYVLNANEDDFKRYCSYVVPAITAITIWPLTISQHKITRGLMVILVLIICTYQGFLSFNQDYYYVSGYKEAARYVMANYTGQTILFGGYYDGNFIFHVRQYDPHKKAIVLRDSKVFATWSVFPEWGYEEYVKSEKDIYDILNKYGTRYIVVEEEDVFNKIPFKILRQMLKKDDFTLEKTIKIKTNLPRFSKQSLLIYKYKKEPISSDENLMIDFPLLNRKINVPLGDLSLKEGWKR